MKHDLKHNGSGYVDETAFIAIKNTDYQPPEVTELVKVLKYIIHKSGYEVEGRIALKDNKTGKVYR